jgi:predicted DNA-binding transcriptional regulator AlpA
MRGRPRGCGAYAFTAGRTYGAQVTLPKLLTAAELADYLGVDVRTLERWRRLGRGPRVTRVGDHKVRYAEPDVAEWLSAGGDSKLNREKSTK